VFALYAFVRTADDLVDTLPQDVSGLKHFSDSYRAALMGMPAGTPVIDDFVALATRRRFEPEWTESFLAAMRRDLEPAPYETIAELESYMYGSAEVIGLYLARILDLPDAALPPARWLGKAMQYANFLRDVAEDHALGRTYIPRAVLAAHGLDTLAPDNVRSHPDRFCELVRHEIARYRRWQAQAEVGYAYLPPRVRAPVAAAAAGGPWTSSRPTPCEHSRKRSNRRPPR
jgi:phytoene synthase